MSSSVDVSFDNVLDVDLSGIPSEFTITVLNIPRIAVGLEKVTIGLDPITINPLTIQPIDVTVRLREFPSIRAHLPANFSVGFAVLGYELLCIRLQGEAQLITEPYDPTPCEECGPARQKPPGITVRPPVTGTIVT